MIVLHVAPIRWQEIGGLAVSIPALVAAQNSIDGVHAALAISTVDAGEPPEAGLPTFHGKIRLGRGGRLSLPDPFDRPDVVVFHSTYIPEHARLAARLRKAGIPYIICPRGGMTHYAQAYRSWKKKLANLFFFDRMVSRAAAVHYLSQGEAEVSRGWNRPKFVVGNGASIPPPAELATPGQSGQLRLVFIGRLHVQYKGLDMLLEACHDVRPELQRARALVELYGPDWRGSARLLAERITGLHLEDLVRLHGPVVDRVKASVLHHADVFLHPSRSEGHPMAVLEALAYGVPCLLTPVTNMAEEVAAAGAGWSVEPSPNGIADGLRQVLAAGRLPLQQAGAFARRLAAERYGWETVAAQSLQAYRRWAA
ncbi:MAG: glycosyltransferase [Pirellulales bacterium]|nr:glycosyltransferase [Pirellulales bacterium]